MATLKLTRSFETETWLNAPISEVFAFFSDPHNLESLTPPWLHFHILTKAPVVMRRGTRIDYVLTLRGLPVWWRTRITTWEPPHRFVDRQLFGPYLWWNHEHIFEEKEDGTRVVDRVTYQHAGGPLVERTLVRPDLERIFAYRHERLRAKFG